MRESSLSERAVVGRAVYTSRPMGCWSRVFSIRPPRSSCIPRRGQVLKVLGSYMFQKPRHTFSTLSSLSLPLSFSQLIRAIYQPPPSSIDWTSSCPLAELCGHFARPFERPANHSRISDDVASRWQNYTNPTLFHSPHSFSPYISRLRI